MKGKNIKLLLVMGLPFQTFGKLSYFHLIDEYFTNITTAAHQT